jgi:hypothetical protein
MHIQTTDDTRTDDARTDTQNKQTDELVRDGTDDTEGLPWKGVEGTRARRTCTRPAGVQGEYTNKSRGGHRASRGRVAGTETVEAGWRAQRQ